MRIHLIAVGIAVPSALAQPDAYLLNDRTNDAIWRVLDANASGVITEPGEIRAWFSAANAAGTVGPDNPTSLGTRADGYTVMGDQGLGVVFGFRDLTGDGDAMDAGESMVVADATNAEGASFAFPTGAAFDQIGTLYVVNAGNTFGRDAVYRMRDTNGDGDYQDAGEIDLWIGDGAFGPGNGPWSPQEIVFVPAPIPIGLLRNSSAGLHGVYRFIDLDGNGHADDPGEFTAYFDATNASGITPSAGAGLDLDRANPGAVYMLQTATGSVDQLIRLTDTDGDSTAQGPGEAVIVFQTSESGFTNIDVVSAADGRVFITDNSGKRVIVLRDVDGDGLFMSAGERADYYASSGTIIGDIRQMAPITVPVLPCYPDCNGDGALNLADFGCFQTKFALGDPYADCNGDGVRNLSDFGCFQTKFALGCP